MYVSMMMIMMMLMMYTIVLIGLLMIMIMIEKIGDERLLAKANEAGRRLLPAFNTTTGIPMATVNLLTFVEVANTVVGVVVVVVVLVVVVVVLVV